MAISKHDKQALAQLFIDMGVPLVVAMQTVESWGGDTKPQSERAQELAKLLNISVEFATKITKKLGIRDSYTLENIRGKIIRIVTPIIGERYVANGTLPESKDLDGLTDLFDVLMSFSESISPTGDDKSQADTTAIFIQSIEPAIAALQSEKMDDAKSLLPDITKSLMARANGLADDLGINDAIQSGLLKSVTQVFVSCYTAHGGSDIDVVWADCDERLAIIRGLTKFVGDNLGIDTNKPVAPKSTTIKAEPQKAAAPKTEQPKKTAESDDDDDADDEDFNPMAFFSAGGK